MSTRTVKLPLVNTDAGSRLIGYLASQQRLAYNHAVHVLNHEPSIPKRATTDSSYGLNKRTTAWRNQDPKARHAPYHIHQQGSEAAHLANQGLIDSRINRLERIEAAHARDDQPHPSDARPHRRTLARRSRKHGTQTLTIRARQFITPIGRYTFTVAGVDHVFRVRRPLPDNILTMQFVEIPDRRRSVNAPLHAIPYQLHVAVSEEGPVPRQLYLPICRQLVLPIDLLLLAALLGRAGAVAGDVKLQDDGVMDHPVNRRGGGHGVGEDALPLREDQV